MSDMNTVDFGHARQRALANTSASTGQSADLAKGAGVDEETKSVVETAGILAASETGVRVVSTNLNDTTKTPGVVVGMTGAPSIDDPASVDNLNRELQRLFLQLQTDNDGRQSGAPFSYGLLLELVNIASEAMLAIARNLAPSEEAIELRERRQEELLKLRQAIEDRELEELEAECRLYNILTANLTQAVADAIRDRIASETEAYV